MTAAADREAEYSARSEQRIAWLTPAVGLAAAAAVALAGQGRIAAGVAAGALLAWLNFRWLAQAVDALVRVSTAQPEGPAPRISPWLYVKFFGRYGLLGVALYVMVARFDVPAWSLIAGLLALGAAVMIESLYQVAARNP
jgi:small-conductance mechanosensitive channel